MEDVKFIHHCETFGQHTFNKKKEKTKKFFNLMYSDFTKTLFQLQILKESALLSGCTLPSTCAEVANWATVPHDRDFALHINGSVMVLYCHGLGGSTQKTYISLQQRNQFDDFNNNGGRRHSTFYTKVGLFINATVGFFWQLDLKQSCNLPHISI